MKVKVEVEGRGFPLKIIIGYLLSSFSVGSIGKRGSLTIVLLLHRAVNTERTGGQLSWLNCQGWPNLPDILVFVLLCFLKKSFQILISLGDFLLKKPKRGSFVKWCISIVISRIFNISKLNNSMKWFKKKKHVSGLL